MFVKVLRSQFYDILARCGERVLVVVAATVDGLCAARQFETALATDDVAYTVVTIDGPARLTATLREHGQWALYVVLIECGAQQNLQSIAATCGCSDDAVFFVVDSRRPYDLDNVFSDHVRLVIDDDDCAQLDVPRYDQVHETASDSESDTDDNDENAVGSDEDLFDDADNEDAASPVKKRQRKTAHRAHRRETGLARTLRKQRWTAERDELLWTYLEFDYRQTPSSHTMFQLCNQLSLVTARQSWQCIVGCTSHLVNAHWSTDHYNAECATSLRQCWRTSRTMGSNAANNQSMTIKFDNDLTIPLYRQWSLIESLSHSQAVFSALQMWTRQGTSTLLKFLARVGIPLCDSRQAFDAMTPTLRGQVVALVKDKLDEFGIDESALTLGVFSASAGYAQAITSLDMVHIASALAHLPPPSTAKAGGAHAVDGEAGRVWRTVQRAIDQPSGVDCQTGIASAKAFLAACVRETSAALLQSHAVPNMAFILLNVQPTNDCAYFRNAYGLTQLGHFFLRTYMNTPRGVRHAGRALLLSMAVTLEDLNGWHYMCGVPPLNTLVDDQPKTLLPRSMELAAKNANCEYHHDFFDMSIIRIRCEDKARFVDSLLMLLN